MKEWAPIETKHAGYTFRSRLEATWAAFFTLLGWVWEPEPLDLDGYIPDFALLFPHAPLLVEVKPELTLAGLEQYQERLESSGWTGEFLLVGATPLFPVWEGAAMGLLAERGFDPDDDATKAFWAWGEAVFFRCHGHYGIVHQFMCFNCRHCNRHDGNCPPWGEIEAGSDQWSKVLDLWLAARSETRWLPPR